MRIEQDAIETARQLFGDGNRSAVLSLSVTDMTLGAALEAACWLGQAAEASDEAELRAHWASSCPLFADVSQCLKGHGPRAPRMHSAPMREVRNGPTRDDLVNGLGWSQFLDRFRRSLVSRMKLEPPLARALAAALHELADNVVQHAELTSSTASVIAYQVDGDTFSFGCADSGRGVRASLRENPEFSQLPDASTALDLAVLEQRSRRCHGVGHGFKSIISAVSDLDGRWDFRSDDARLRLDGRGAGNRSAVRSNSAWLGGTQICVSASPSHSVWRST